LRHRQRRRRDRFCARILDANGKPVTNLKISLAEPGK
jgi:hypothetical protein